MDGDTPEMRLAKALIARRIELGYPKRTKFAEEAGLSHDRTIGDLERAKGQKHSSTTIALVEQVYQWEPGSIDRILAGGRAIRLPGTPGAVAADAAEAALEELHAAGHPVVDSIVEILNSAFGPAAKVAMIQDVVDRDYAPHPLLNRRATSDDAPQSPSTR